MPEKEKREVEYGTGHVEVALVTGKHDGAVKTVYIPPFITMPDVIVCGMRSFKKTDGETDDGGYVYSEAFTYHVAPDPTEKAE